MIHINCRSSEKKLLENLTSAIPMLYLCTCRPDDISTTPMRDFPQMIDYCQSAISKMKSLLRLAIVVPIFSTQRNSFLTNEYTESHGEDSMNTP